MKVWLITRKDWEGRDAGNECVVLQQPKYTSSTYGFAEFTLIASPEQKEAVDAQRRVRMLSTEAYKKLGITFRHVARLDALAEPEIDIKPGDIVYASSAAHGPRHVSGVYTWPRPGLDEWSQPLKVFQSLEIYHAEKKAEMVEREVASFPASVKRLMGMKV